MFTVTCGLEVEDLYYAVLTRIQVVERMLREAQSLQQTRLVGQFQGERVRLGMVRDHLQAHISDHDYRFDEIGRLFPEG